MDDRPSAQSFGNHRNRPHFHHLTLPSLQSPEMGCQPTQEQCGSRGEESTSPFQTLSSYSLERRGSSSDERAYPSRNSASSDGDVGLRGRFDRDGVLEGHFATTWFSSCRKEEVWEDGESCETSADDCYGISNVASYYNGANCGNREGLRLCDQFSVDAKGESIYSRQSNISHCAKPVSHSRCSSGSFNSDSSVDYCQRDSKVKDSYSGREEDYRIESEDRLQAADVDAPWFSVSPSSQTEEVRWRGERDFATLTSAYPPQRSPITSNNGTCSQKLDSFSEAFLSHRKRRFPVIPSGDSSAQIWKSGQSPGLVMSRNTCTLDSDSYLLASSYYSPNPPSLPSFQSPPKSSHLMSSVLSPPPTPLPVPPHSPCKMDSPVYFGLSGHSVSQGEESLGATQFFNSCIQPLPSVLSSGMMWKFPAMSHCFPQSPGDLSSAEGNLRPPNGADYANITVPHDVPQSPESSFPTSSVHRLSSHTQPRALCPLNASLQIHRPPPLPPPHLSILHSDAAESTAPSYLVNQKVKRGQATLNHTQLRETSPVYTGTPFPSILHSCGGPKKRHYTPRPLLNPVRRGTGLLSSSVLSLHPKEHKTAFYSTKEEDCSVLPCVNVGHEFQAELPPCLVNGDRSAVSSPEEEFSTEQLLWKPWEELEESEDIRNRVENLVSLCSSSCLAGGGSNTELALHCLHYCRGDMVATLEMLLFHRPSPAGDYHYAGSDFWTDSEKGLFSAALGTYGKDYCLIQKMVRTKTVSQCIEFYYLSKKILDKQKKQNDEESRDGQMEQQTSVTPTRQPLDRPFGLVEAVPLPSLASFFPCKLCGKMFYKIKSRNAHMKIHRQPQEDWADRRLQHQLLTQQRLTLSCPTNLISRPDMLPPQTQPLTLSSSGQDISRSDNMTSNGTIAPTNGGSIPDPTYNNMVASNPLVITPIDASEPNQRDPTSVLPFQQSWLSFGHGPGAVAFYCNTEQKAGPVGEENLISWQ